MKTVFKKVLAAAVSAVMVCLMMLYGNITQSPQLTAQAVSGTSNYTEGLDHYPMYNYGSIRSCTSVAWECVYYNSGIQMYGYLGHGKYWFENAPSHGLTTTTSIPHEGYVACFTDDGIGHVAYVLSVNQNAGTMTIYEGGIDYFDNGLQIQCTGNIGNGLNIRTTSYKIGSSDWGFVLQGFIEINPPLIGDVMTEEEAAGQTIPDGEYYIVSELDRGYYLDIPGNDYDTKNGNQVCMWYWGETNTSKEYDVFRLEYQTDGVGKRFYRLYQRTTNQCLDVIGADLHAGKNINMYGSHDSYGQFWSIERTNHGYRLRSKANGFCLDVIGGIVENGHELQTYPLNDSAAQSFSFIPYQPKELVEDGIYKISFRKNTGWYLNAVVYPEAGDMDETAIFKLRNNLPLTPDEYQALTAILMKDLGNPEDYQREFGDTPLGLLVRKVAKMEREAAMQAFSSFINEQNLNQQQIVFVHKIVDYVVENGYIESIKILMSPPFDKPQNFLRLFSDAERKLLMQIVNSIRDNAVVILSA